MTQYFFNADSYFRFVEDSRKAGIDIPITPQKVWALLREHGVNE